MKNYTVVFNHPEDSRLTLIHINTLATRYVHLMFFGKLANEWGYGWNDLKFAQQTDLEASQGTIMIDDQPLHYHILSDDLKANVELAMSN